MSFDSDSFGDAKDGSVADSQAGAAAQAADSGTSVNDSGRDSREAVLSNFPEMRATAPGFLDTLESGAKWGSVAMGLLSGNPFAVTGALAQVGRAVSKIDFSTGPNNGVTGSGSGFTFDRGDSGGSGGFSGGTVLSATSAQKTAESGVSADRSGALSADELAKQKAIMIAALEKSPSVGSAPAQSSGGFPWGLALAIAGAVYFGA